MSRVMMKPKPRLVVEKANYGSFSHYTLQGLADGVETGNSNFPRDNRLQKGTRSASQNLQKAPPTAYSVGVFLD